MLGPSGCGKSTLLRAVAGLETLDAGSVSYDGRDLAGTPTHKRGFALMFQDGQLFPHQSVAGNVGYPLRLRRTPRGHRRPPRRRAAGAGRPARHRGPQHDPSVRRRAPARRPGPGARGRAPAAAARRAAVRPRPRPARAARPRPARHPRRRRYDGPAGHPRPGGGVRGRRPDGADARAGRVVQAGSLDEVWRAPVDAEAARFLGYADRAGGRRGPAVLGGRGGGPVALRRSALRVGAGRVAARPGRVRTGHPGPGAPHRRRRRRRGAAGRGRPARPAAVQPSPSARRSCWWSISPGPRRSAVRRGRAAQP